MTVKHAVISFVITGMILILASMVSAAENETTTQTRVASEALKLWYAQPATEWTEALPIGNGRLGAMVFGGIQQERLQLNDDTLWSGGPHCYDNPDAYGHLSTVRELLERGEYAEAEATAEKMLGIHKYQQAYMPLGDLLLDFPKGKDPSDYHRELNLQNAVSTVTYRIGNAHFTRRGFASQPDQAIVIRLECDTPGRITFDLSMTSPHDFQSQSTADDMLLMTGQVAPRTGQGASGARRLIGPWDGEGMNFAAQVKVVADDGRVVAEGDKLSVRNADAVTLVYVAATSYVNYQDVSADPVKRVEDYIARAGDKSYEQLYQRHVDDYSNLFGRVAINLGGTGTGESLPTDERIRLLMLVVFAAPGESFALDIYVSVDGGAQADGSLAKPYGSLPDAVEAVRALRKAGHTEPVVIILREGRHQLNQTLVLGMEDGSPATSDDVALRTVRCR